MTNAPFLAGILIYLCRTSVNLEVQEGRRDARDGSLGWGEFIHRLLSLSKGVGHYSEGNDKSEGSSKMIT